MLVIELDVHLLGVEVSVLGCVEVVISGGSCRSVMFILGLTIISGTDQSRSDDVVVQLYLNSAHTTLPVPFDCVAAKVNLITR